ncbi:hypothetical protein RUM44_008611 [Polyplax serrata]|uniref:R3H domain-containing protein n=1 Tax=Polyplax serrata TaxID=468196 RepID=A0ABR1B8Q5_POLSC
MGVIKRIENLFEIKCSVSEETLYIPSSDDEGSYSQSENNLPILERPQTIRQRHPTIGPSYSPLKNHSGKKKFRRYNNVNQLLTLTEEDELQEVTIDDFIVNTKSAFAKVMEDDESLQKWNEFISNSEERQRELLETSNNMKNHSNRPVINKRLRSLLRKKNLPLGMLHYLEQELISFFSAEPTKIYISPALSSFERLLLHSISNYHRLASLSFLSEPEKVKLVRVKNPRNEFPFPSLLLMQYLETNYGVR